MQPTNSEHIQNRMEALNQTGKIPLIGCGILKNEVLHLIRKNNWLVKPHFLNSSLHIDFGKLEKTLVKSMNHFGSAPKGVIYGTCHPRMDTFIKEGNAVRTQGQNCVELLLGKNKFDRYLFSGAFFIMEDWAKRWDLITGLTFGPKREIIKEIFTMEHTHLLGLKTPCSGDFGEKAKRISQELELPLEWLSVPLDHLEKVLVQMLSSLEKN